MCSDTYTDPNSYAYNFAGLNTYDITTTHADPIATTYADHIAVAYASIVTGYAWCIRRYHDSDE